MTTTTTARPPISVLDLGDLVSDDTERQGRFIDAVGSALSDTGFLVLENHGVSSRLVARTYSLAERFFDLPESVKSAYEQPALLGTRGYTVFRPDGAEGAALDPEWKESWNCGPELPLGGAFASTYPPNRWPGEVRGFRGAVSQLYDVLEACAMRILDACSLYIDEPWRRFRDQIAWGNSLLRVLHYPAPRGPAAACLRVRGHEDLSLITLLCAPTEDGLEVLTPEGRWQEVKARPGAIVVSSGQMMHHVTSGLFRSAEHRVVTPPSVCRSRYTIAFFVQPRAEVDLTPTPECVRRMGAPADAPAVTAGEFFRLRLREQPAY
jgi:isopenicillin N synthase-like dioxygenase